MLGKTKSRKGGTSCATIGFRDAVGISGRFSVGLLLLCRSS
jgi:hypothetical protein